METSEPTLASALRETDEHRWRGMRSRRRNYCQACIAVATLERLLQATTPARPKRTRPDGTIIVRGFTIHLPAKSQAPKAPGHSVPLAKVTRDVLRAAVRVWQSEGTQAATIVGRLNCLSAMGVNVKGSRPRIPRKLKWWLSPDQQDIIIAALTDNPTLNNLTLADLIEWTVLTGLRIEETLRLDFHHITKREVWIRMEENGPPAKCTRTFMSVPGLKTASAQASLPLPEEAARIIERRREATTGHSVFDVRYHTMQRAWSDIRHVLGLPDPKAATLKALRRSAARALTTKGMPLDLVRHYLRHEDVATTMGYLRLTGGYNDAEMLRWL